MDYYNYHYNLFQNETVLTNSNAIVEFLNCINDSPTYFDYKNLKKIILADDMTGKYYKHLFSEWKQNNFISRTKLVLNYFIKGINFQSLIKHNNKMFRKELHGNYMNYYYKNIKVFKKEI